MKTVTPPYMKDRTAETFDSVIQLRKFSPFCLGPRDAAFGLALTHWCLQPSQTLPSTPPSSTALSLSFLLSLTLTQWAISVAGGFYLCSQARCRHGEGLLCSGGLCIWKSVCNQEVTFETGATRKPFLTFHTKSEDSVSINHAVQFRRNAFVWERLDPARLKLPCR